METQGAQIEHPGIIEKMEGGKVTVRIESRSACGSCHGRSHCSMSDMEEKTVEVQTTGMNGFRAGQSVILTLERSLGFKALVLGYIIPLIILIAGILLMMLITRNEALSALTGIFLLVPYYFWIYQIREKLRGHFHFRIRA